MSRPRLDTEFDSPKVSPGFLLWQTTNKWQARQRRALADFGLTHVQFVLLASLVWASDETDLTQKQLGARTQTDLMMTSQVVRRLAEKGLLTRTPKASDTRSFILKPTAAGAQLANKAVKVVEAVDKEFFAVLSNDLPGFTVMMQQLADNNE